MPYRVQSLNESTEVVFLPQSSELESIEITKSSINQGIAYSLTTSAMMGILSSASHERPRTRQVLWERDQPPVAYTIHSFQLCPCPHISTLELLGRLLSRSLTVTCSRRQAYSHWTHTSAGGSLQLNTHIPYLCGFERSDAVT